MSSNTMSRQSRLNQLENQEKLAMQEEEHWIKAGNTLRALQARIFKDKFSHKKEQLILSSEDSD